MIPQEKPTSLSEVHATRERSGRGGEAPGGLHKLVDGAFGTVLRSWV